MLKQSKVLIPAIILLLIVFSIGLGFWLSLPRADELPASVRIAPSAQEDSGISVNAAFSLTCDFALKETTIRSMLVLDPPINYTLSGGGKEWNLKPVLPLKENTIYTFRVNNESGSPVQSFAFQTRTDLLITSVFPQEKEGYVDVNTGIEIKFNRPGVDLSQGFEILPPVSGRFESLEYACRFIPDAPLDYNSIYRITLKNLKSSDGAVLTEPITYFFETMEEGDGSWDDLSVSGPTASFLPGGDLKVALFGGDAQGAETYTMTLHKYAGIKVYEAALRQRDAFYREQYGVKERYTIPTTGLDEVMSVESTLMRTDYRLYAPLPKDLSEGYYLFTLQGKSGEKEQFVQQLIQVVNLSVYTQSTGEDTLFWLGDPVTASPASGASIDVETASGKHFTGTTDEKGMLLLNTKGEENAYALITREGTPVWVAPIPLGPISHEEEPLSTDYYAAAYTDRDLYHPGDEISFWGVIKPRTTQVAPQSVQVSLATRWPDNTIMEIPIEVAADGTFSGKLQPEALRAGAYYLMLRDQDGGVYLERYVEISEYTKPTYQISLKTDKEVYDYGESVQFTVEAHYYDGTPAAGVKLLAECSSARVNDYALVLDKDGRATFKSVLDPSTAYPGGNSVAEWEPQYVGWSVRSADEQTVNLSEGGSFRALPSKIAASMEYKGDGKVAVSCAFLDESKLDEPETFRRGYMQSSFERLRGNPADIPMTLIVYKTTYRRNQTGTYFDAVNKESVPIYETTSEETVERSVPLSTVMGSALVEDLPAQGTADTSYRYELRFAGGVYGDVCALAYPTELSRLTSDTRYTFFPTSESITAAPGEKITIGVYENSVAPATPGTVLYSLVQKGTVLQDTFTGASTELEMTDSYLPNIWLVGAYFDGRAIYPMERSNLSYDYEKEVLQIAIETDKEEYRPGDPMEITLTVKDAQGAPVTGQAAVGVVDEAVFDVSAQTVDLAGQIYRDIYYPDIVTSVTLAAPKDGEASADDMVYESAMDEAGKAPANMGAPMNTGGGGSMTRSVFADTAAFRVVPLTDGVGKVTLVLPHNITAWRITAAAVTPKLQAGDTLTTARATQPFYLLPIVSDSYLVGDDVTVSVLAVGTAISGKTDDIRYTATLSGEKMRTETAQDVTVPVGERAAFHFGQLPAGAYRVRIEASGPDNNSDALELPLTVTESGLLTPIIKTMELSDLATLQSESWPVEVTIYNDSVKPMFETLTWLSAQQGQRTEILAAATRADELYRELLPRDQRQSITRDARITLLEDADGGIAPLPKAASDPALTAKLLIAAPELLNRGNAITYLQGVLKNPAATPDDRIMAYVGLAAAKQPVLLDLRRLYEEDGESMKPYQRLYVGAAFARMGDFDRAREIYESVRTVRSGEQLYTEGDNRTQTTAAALLLASELSHADANGLAQFLMNGASDSGKEGVLWHLELLSYAKKIGEQGTDSGKFAYESGGKTMEVALEQGAATISPDAATLRDGKFRAVSGSGKLYAAARVWQPGNNAANSDFVEITKTYQPVDSTLRPGGQVKVTVRMKFREDAPYGMYTLSDYIPSGMRWLAAGEQRVYSDSAIWPILTQDGQKINGAVYHLKPGIPDGPVPLAPLDGVRFSVLSGAVDTPSSGKVPAIAEGSPSEKVPPNTDDSVSDSDGKVPPNTDEPVADSDAPSADPNASVSVAEGEEPQGVLPDIEPDTGETPPADAAEQPTAEQTNPAADQAAKPKIPVQPPVEEVQEDGVVVLEYYLSAALPGSYVTESIWLTYDGQTAKSERGTLVVAD